MALSWTARTKIEKAQARRLINAGKAKIVARIHETYIGKRSIVSYEAWEIEASDAVREAMAEVA